MSFGRRELLMMTAGSFVWKGVLKGQQFEVASIKPSAPMEMGRMMVGMQMLPGGRVSMSGVTARLLIQQAYGVRDFQISGGPDWMRSSRYDIVAKPENASNGDQVKVMIQGLLADRFQLKFHRETKELPTYALVVAKGGPKLKASEVETGSDAPKGTRMRMMGRGHVEMNAAPIAALANQLSQSLGRSVIDKTELTGNYDFKLEWTPDEQVRAGGPSPDAPASSSDSVGPSIFSALQEQLGLKLESTKGPVEILAIEGAQKPSEN